jgi:hypothetical protein
MAYYTDEFNALNSLIGALGSDTLSAGNSYELGKVALLQKLVSIFGLNAIATGQSIKTDSLGAFIPANFADSLHSHTNLDSLVSSKPAKTFLAAPSDTLGEPSYRTIGLEDIPTELSSLAGGSFSPQSHSHSSLDSLTAPQAAKSFLASPTNSTGAATYRAIEMGDLPGQLSSLSGGAYAPLAHNHLIGDLPVALGTAIGSTIAKSFWATPIGNSGTPSFREIVISDLPTILAREDEGNYYAGSQQLQAIAVTSAVSITIDTNSGTWFVISPLAHNTTIQLPAFTSGKTYRIILSIQQPATPLPIDWSTSFKFQNKVKPIATTNPGGWDEFLLICPNGTDWLVSQNVSYGSL